MKYKYKNRSYAETVAANIELSERDRLIVADSEHMEQETVPESRQGAAIPGAADQPDADLEERGGFDAGTGERESAAGGAVARRNRKKMRKRQAPGVMDESGQVVDSIFGPVHVEAGTCSPSPRGAAGGSREEGVATVAGEASPLVGEEERAEPGVASPREANSGSAVTFDLGASTDGSLIGPVSSSEEESDMGEKEEGEECSEGVEDPGGGEQEASVSGYSGLLPYQQPRRADESDPERSSKKLKADVTSEPDDEMDLSVSSPAVARRVSQSHGSGTQGLSGKEWQENRPL